MFCIYDVTAGKLNALVKNIMDQMGSKVEAVEAVRRINAKEWRVIKNTVVALLEYKGTTTSSTETQFIASKRFCIGSSEVKISLLSEKFMIHFLGKIEMGREGPSIHYYEVSESPSTSLEVIYALGEGLAVELRLCELFELLLQDKRRQGFLVEETEKSNNCFIRDINENLMRVSCQWTADGWEIDAESIGARAGISVGSKVFYSSCK